MIRTASIHDPRAPGEGTRILIARFRPRGVKKADETWDAWDRRLSPSQGLLDAYLGKRRAGTKLIGKRLEGISWDRYAERFLAEMEEPEARAAIEELALRSAAMETITLVCHCADESRCHRSLVKRLVQERQRRL